MFISGCQAGMVTSPWSSNIRNKANWWHNHLQKWVERRCFCIWFCCSTFICYFATSTILAWPKHILIATFMWKDTWIALLSLIGLWCYSSHSARLNMGQIELNVLWLGHQRLPSSKTVAIIMSLQIISGIWIMCNCKESLEQRRHPLHTQFDFLSQDTSQDCAITLARVNILNLINSYENTHAHEWLPIWHSDQSLILKC